MQYYRAHWKAQGLTNRANNECRFGDMLASGMSDIECEVTYVDCVKDNNLDHLPEEIKKN